LNLEHDMAQTNLDALVLLREVVDPRPPAEPIAEGAMVRERGLRRLVNPADLEALESALALGLGPVTALAVGPERLEDGLRVAIAMGAARAVRVWDHALEGGDATADARLLRRVLEILRPGLVVAGSSLTDRGDEPSPALAAALLGFPVVNAAVSCRISGGTAEVLRKGDRGARQRISVPTPCMVLFEPGTTVPRYPDMETFLGACAAEVELWGLPELDLPPWEVGEEGARLRPDGVSFPRPRPVRVITPSADLPAPDRVAALLSGGIQARAGVMHFGTADEAAQGLLRILRREGLVPGGQP
jgi:electron transfer flavoprotein beta subunit